MSASKCLLLDLPDELIVSICDELKCDTDISMLHVANSLASEGLGQLAGTCKLLRVIAWPMTYHRLRLGPHSFGRSTNGLESDLVGNAKSIIVLFKFPKGDATQAYIMRDKLIRLHQRTPHVSDICIFFDLYSSQSLELYSDMMHYVEQTYPDLLHNLVEFKKLKRLAVLSDDSRTFGVLSGAALPPTIRTVEFRTKTTTEIKTLPKSFAHLRRLSLESHAYNKTLEELLSSGTVPPCLEGLHVSNRVAKEFEPLCRTLNTCLVHLSILKQLRTLTLSVLVALPVHSSLERYISFQSEWVTNIAFMLPKLEAVWFGPCLHRQGSLTSKIPPTGFWAIKRTGQGPEIQMVTAAEYSRDDEYLFRRQLDPWPSGHSTY